MGGTVVVAHSRYATMSTRQFVGVAEAIRMEFSPEEDEVMREVFSPMDDGEMTFISAMELAPEAFAVFVRAVQRAHIVCRQRGNIIVNESVWQELLEAISIDPRYPRGS